MTLVAGFKCRDGFVVAADTEITYGPILFQSSKLAEFHGESAPYDLVIGGAGRSTYVAMAAQKIGGAITKLADPSADQIKAEVDRLIVEIHDTYIFKHWDASDANAPTVNLIIGLKDSAGKIAVLKTDRTATATVESWGFVGSGAILAEYLAERLFMPELSAAVVIHLVRQLFRELKVKGTSVGGNTEIRAVRRDENAEQFFDLEGKDYRFLWGLDEILASAARIALDRDKSEKFLKQRIREIAQRLRELRRGAESERHLIADGITVTEFGVTGYGNPFKDVG